MAFDYFTIEELRSLPDVRDETRFPTAICERAAEYIVGTIEREVGTSFVPRTRTATYSGGTYELVLDDPYVLSVSSVALNDSTPLTSGFAFRDGILTIGTRAPFSLMPSGTVAVTYQAGYSASPPADVKEAALQGTRAYLMENATDAGTNARRSSISSEQGTINLVLAGKDNPTGYPALDAMIVSYREKLDVFGFA